MDAFFASIEQRDNPNYRSKPVIVGADPLGGKGRGVVSTCSYEARKFGICSAMPISIAFRHCPHGIFLPVNMDKYEEVSAEIYDILYSFTPDIEVVGIDEAFLDITGSFHLFDTPAETCRNIKSKILESTGLTSSVGLAPTKMAAKIASDLKKPDGLVEVKEEKTLDFLWRLEIGKIWGLGKKSEETLQGLGIRTIGDLAKYPVENLCAIFGKTGKLFHNLANGIDPRPVSPRESMKSISSETTFKSDTHDKEKIDSVLMGLSEALSARLRTGLLKCRTVTLKIRFEDFDTHTRSNTMCRATNFVDVLYKESKSLYNDFEKYRKRVRLVGIKASGLQPSYVRDDIFSEFEDNKIEGLHKAVDRIKGRFGGNSLYRASSRI